MPGPIRPEDIAAAKVSNFPDVVFQVFNRLIAQAWTGRSATIRQEDVVAALEAEGITKETISKEHYLDVEPAYEAAGWTVRYDKPGASEAWYPPSYEFSK